VNLPREGDHEQVIVQRTYTVRAGTRDGAVIGMHRFDDDQEHDALKPREFELAGKRWTVIDFFVSESGTGDTDTLVVEEAPGR
jgi:hypothetical protein